MSRQAIEREVVRVLQEHVLLGSNRKVDLGKPLGPGVGLDSLGLMEFLAALERQFEIEFPDTLWTDRAQFTLCRLADHLVAMDARVAPVAPAGGLGPRP